MGLLRVCQSLCAACSMWYFDVESSLRRLLSDPEVRRHILARTARRTEDPTSFFASEAYRLLDEDCAKILSDEQVLSIVLSLGGDGVQLLNWGTRTATVIGLKCEDLPPHLVQTGRAVLPLVVVEGPKEPAVLKHILAPAAKFFAKHAPSSDGKGEFSLL